MKRLVYSGNPYIVGYMVITLTVAGLGLWVWTHTDKPLSPKELYSLEESQWN